jgi:hypothetical protein
MKLQKADSRDKRIKKVRYGMRVSGKNTIFLIQEILIKKGQKAKGK